MSSMSQMEGLDSAGKELMALLQKDLLEYTYHGRFFPYEYRKLDRTRREIRLFKLLPGKFGERLAGEISIVSLDSNPVYEALSYTWGNAVPKVPIQVQGKPVGITINLEKALRRLRTHSTPLILWIDAICINQDDLEERSQQVLLMGDIYRQSERVIIWLGDDAPLMESSGPADLSGKPNFLISPVYDPFIFLREMSTGVHMNECLGFDKNTRGMAMNFFIEWQILFDAVTASPWWSRTWVVQETLLPNKALVGFGCCSILWKEVVDAVQNIKKHQSSCCARPWGMDAWRSDIDLLIRRVDEIESVRSLLRSAHKPTLHGLLHSFRSRKATDPRDKIYGLLGLEMTVTKAPPLKPDYNASVADVFEQAASNIILGSESLDFLIGHNVWDEAITGSGMTAQSFLGSQATSSIEDLPTWVPDWSISQHDTHRFEVLRSEIARTFFKASSVTSNPAISISNHCLTVPGLRVDVIWEVSRLPFPALATWTPPNEFAIYAGRAMDAWSALAMRIPMPNSHHGVAENVHMALARTILAGAILDTTDSTIDVDISMARTVTDDDVVDWFQWFTDNLNPLFELAQDPEYLKTSTNSPDNKADRDSLETKRAFASDHFDLVRKTWTSPIGISTLTSCLRRTVFRTQHGLLGIGPSNLRPFDQIFILDGGKTPFVLRNSLEELKAWARPLAEARTLGDIEKVDLPLSKLPYAFVGDCYVDGVMDGKYAEEHVSEKKIVTIR